MKRPALGHLLGYTALTIVLTAGAAQSLSGSNTVFSDDIVDGAIYNPDIHDRAVTGRKVLDNSITGADVLGTSLIYELDGESAELAAGESLDFEASCASAADKALSGEWEAWNESTDEPADQVAVSVNTTTDTGDAWFFHIKNTSATTVAVSTWVLCMQR